MKITKPVAAQSADLPQLNTLMYQLHKDHHQQCPDHFKSAEEVAKEKDIASYLNNPECLVYVVKEGDLVVGFVTGHFCELISQVSQPVQMGSIDELYVLPEYRKQGVANLLTDKIEHSFDDYGVTQIFVEVWAFNKAAIEFYRKRCFANHILCLRKAIESD